MEYIYYPDVEFKEYINHQTQLNKEYGYYFIENIALFEVFNGKKIVIKYFNKIDNDLIPLFLTIHSLFYLIKEESIFMLRQ